MINKHCLSITHHNSQPMAQNCTPWFTPTGLALLTMTHNHLLSITYQNPQSLQWLWVIVCYTEAVVVNHGVLYWASGCDSWYVLLNQWLWIVGNDTEPVVVNHGVICWANGCESWCVMLSQWLLIMLCYAESQSMNHSHWLIIAYHDSQPLAQHYTPWLTTTGSA
jgi:hypothetical protein